MPRTFAIIRLSSLKVIAYLAFTLVIGILTSCPLKAAIKVLAKTDIESTAGPQKTSPAVTMGMSGFSCSVCTAIHVTYTKQVHSVHIAPSPLHTGAFSTGYGSRSFFVHPVTSPCRAPLIPVYLLYHTLLI